MRRALTAEQQRALAELVALGATLDPDFTVRELRSAFRFLVRRCHPDRHPGSSPAEQARLSQLFAVVTEHYRCLGAVFEPLR